MSLLSVSFTQERKEGHCKIYCGCQTF